MMALQKQDEHDDYQPSPVSKEPGTPQERRGMIKVRSGSNLAAVAVETKQG